LIVLIILILNGQLKLMRFHLNKCKALSLLVIWNINTRFLNDSLLPGHNIPYVSKEANK
jgi:hypothetical protein